MEWSHVIPPALRWPGFLHVPPFPKGRRLSVATHNQDLRCCLTLPTPVQTERLVQSQNEQVGGLQ